MMNNIIQYNVLFISLLIFSGLAISCNQQTEPPAEPAEANAEQLERQMWEAMADNNMTWVEQHVADNFQSVHSDGARGRSEELKLISGLDLGEYTLTEFESTRQDDEIIVTYKVSAAETIEDERTTTAPAPRLSVWSWHPADSTWKWSAHANLKPLGEK